MIDKLLEFYAPDGPERVGFILDDGSIVETPNRASDSENGFDLSAEDIIKYCDRAVASFHTHPGAPANLSKDDMASFFTWTDLTHHVIGNDGIRSFRVQNNKVVQLDASDNSSPRPVEEALP